MVNIWKIGSWPGLWGSNTQKNKKRYIEEYALPRNFVAIGYGWISDFKKIPEGEIRDELGRKTNQILKFTNEIEIGDVILLYNRFKVYVGTVIKPYYYIEKNSKEDFIKNTDNYNFAPHRIDVDWLFNKKEFSVDFSMWRDTVHQVKEEDLAKINDQKLKNFLIDKL